MPKSYKNINKNFPSFVSDEYFEKRIVQLSAFIDGDELKAFLKTIVYLGTAS